jgi:hypothetical protein
MDKTGWRLREDKEWHRYYASSAHPYIYESKFATGEARISLAELQSRWWGWNEGEQVEFARAFGQKPDLSSEDEWVLGFLMQQNGEMVSTSIGILVGKLSDKKRAARFLVDCLRAFPESRGNFLMALGDLAAPETAGDLSSVFQECSQGVARNALGNESLADLLYCSAALFRITAEANYLQLITSYLRHPNDRARYFAGASLLQALSDVPPPETAPELSIAFQECSRNIAEYPQDSMSVADLLYCSAALFRITAESKYLDVITHYLHHANEWVRGVAETAMRRAVSSGSPL